MIKHMIQRRRQKLVSIKNKLFSFDGYLTDTVEVSDSRSNKFVLLKSPLMTSVSSHKYEICNFTSVGNKIVTVSKFDGIVFFMILTIK